MFAYNIGLFDASCSRQPAPPTLAPAFAPYWPKHLLPTFDASCSRTLSKHRFKLHQLSALSTHKIILTLWSNNGWIGSVQRTSMFRVYASACLCCSHWRAEPVWCGADLSMLKYVPKVYRKYRWARSKCNPQQMTSLKSTYQLS